MLSSWFEDNETSSRSSIGQETTVPRVVAGVASAAGSQLKPGAAAPLGDRLASVEAGGGGMASREGSMASAFGHGQHKPLENSTSASDASRRQGNPGYHHSSSSSTATIPSPSPSGIAANPSIADITSSCLSLKSASSATNAFGVASGGPMHFESSQSIGVRSDTPPPPPPAGWLEWSWVDVTRTMAAQGGHSDKDPLEVLSVSSGVISSSSPFFSPGENSAVLASGGGGGGLVDALAMENNASSLTSSSIPLRYTTTPPPFARLVNFGRPTGIPDSIPLHPSRTRKDETDASESGKLLDIQVPVPMTSSTRSLTDQATSNLLHGSGYISLTQSSASVTSDSADPRIITPSTSPNPSLSSGASLPSPIANNGDSAILFNSQLILNHLGIPGAIQREALVRPPSCEGSAKSYSGVRTVSRHASPERQSSLQKGETNYDVRRRTGVDLDWVQDGDGGVSKARRKAGEGFGFSVRYFSFWGVLDADARLREKDSEDEGSAPKDRPWTILNIFGAIVAAGIGSYALMKIGSFCHSKLAGFWIWY
ncbi:hypothetical protein HDU67_003338 [Dinochytrium kinnereticum]|nr:hypothetical protein HDU67_003338 [Dinochytrium kinnereticum]